MNRISIPYDPVEGKTYSLFGKSDSTDEYYQRIEEIADRVIKTWKEPEQLLKAIQSKSKRIRVLRIITGRKENSLFNSWLKQLLHEHLDDYTSKAAKHLRNLSLAKKLWDRCQGTTLEQYQLYMLEIEITNRIHVQQFLESGVKIALLPHCLKDFTTECKSTPDSFDYRCRHCSKNCYEHYISRLLTKYHIETYIWMGAGISKKAKEVYSNHQTLGILGIACIPELVWGMRKCRKYHIPVIGLPLDANRCARWMGEFHRNSINLERLEKLISTSGIG